MRYNVELERNRGLLIAAGFEFGEKVNRYTETAYKFICNNEEIKNRVKQTLDNVTDKRIVQWHNPNEGPKFLNVVIYDQTTDAISHLLLIQKHEDSNKKYYQPKQDFDIIDGSAFIDYQLGVPIKKAIKNSNIINH